MKSKRQPVKQCTRCKEIKTLDLFFKNVNTKDGHACYCKLCQYNERQVYRKSSKGKKRLAESRRKYELRSKFNMSVDDYFEMYEEQDGRCKICYDRQHSYRAHLAIDHCHKTGIIRGLLCNSCNVGIGNLKDSPKVLKRAIAYIKKFGKIPHFKKDKAS